MTQRSQPAIASATARPPIRTRRRIPQPGSQDHESAPEHKAVSGRGAVVGVTIVLIAIVALAVYGIWKRHHNDEVLADTTQRLSAPSVIAIPPKPGAPVDTFVLPGNVTAYTDSPIYARTSGYLTTWYYDIGARVKKGALLAEIATPEVDQQLAQAEADLLTAQANANNAKTQADRYKGLVTSDAVSQQDTDTFVNQAASTSSAVHSAQANVQRLKELQAFEKVYAPFDGVVTARGRRYRPVDQRGRRQRALPHAGSRNPPRLHQCAPGLHWRHPPGREDRSRLPRASGQDCFRARWCAPPTPSTP